MLARVEQERLESLKYDRATIYIKCIDDNDEFKVGNEVIMCKNTFNLLF